MLKILLFYFFVAHVVLKFDYHVHADHELDLRGLGLVGKVSLTSLYKTLVIRELIGLAVVDDFTYG